jgi:nitronate monooxygenase
VIAAGGIRSLADIRKLQALGAAAVQLGTPFAVTLEGDAHPEFKRVLAEAREEDKILFTSVAGLPARAVATPWLLAYLKAEPRLRAVAHAKRRCTKAFDCLAQCGLRDGKAGWGQFCIDQQLATALRGDVRRGLFFTGCGPLPFGSQIRSVHDLLARLLGGDAEPQAFAPVASLA